MSDQLDIVRQLGSEFGLRYGFLYDTSSEVLKTFGDVEKLQHPAIVRRLIATPEDIRNLEALLRSRPFPATFTQGKTRSILGLVDSKFVVGFFLDSDLSAKEHFEFAVRVHKEAVERLIGPKINQQGSPDGAQRNPEI
ncbi:hypothetical protein [Dokdonella sp.]|uniref:hypothetical protein n=1 Tax=Dokdonella sp. TaxID=2291710 RepID=UPI003784416B